MLKPAQIVSTTQQFKTSSNPNMPSQIYAFENSFDLEIIKNQHKSFDVLTYKDGSFDYIPHNQSRLRSVKSAVFGKDVDGMRKNNNISEGQEKSVKNGGKLCVQNWKTKINPQVYYYYKKIIKNQKLNDDNFLDLTPINNTLLSLKTESNKEIKILRNSSQNIKSQYLDLRNKNRKRKFQKELGLNESPKSQMRLERIEKELDHEQCNRKRMGQLQKVKDKYENKLTALQYQNKNLKEELFYLRAAILSKYQTNPGNNKNK